MMKTNRLFAMAMAITMTASSIGTISAFADELHDDPVVTVDTPEGDAAEETPAIFTPEDGSQEFKGLTDTFNSLVPHATGINDPHLQTVNEHDAVAIEEAVDKNVESDVYREDIICIDVEWESLNFVYNYGYKVEYYTWNPDTLKYKATLSNEPIDPGWNKTKADIKLINRSNCHLWVGCKFEKNDADNAAIYKPVSVSFSPKEVEFNSAVGKTDDEIAAAAQTITMNISGEPDYGEYDKSNPPALGMIEFYISKDAVQTKVETPATPATPEETTVGGEHEHHFVYDQFGRLVCTGCNAIKHEFCIDEDEDGLCDECGLDRDFCPDCHYGGTCKCI